MVAEGGFQGLGNEELVSDPCLCDCSFLCVVVHYLAEVNFGAQNSYQQAPTPKFETENLARDAKCPVTFIVAQPYYVRSLCWCISCFIMYSKDDDLSDRNIIKLSLVRIFLINNKNLQI
uniref:Ovule protein n=1 Tax=Heterorhabditis bacteriophora TaxID=37862 RepID=A0A1I7WZS5_HETBA